MIDPVITLMGGSFFIFIHYCYWRFICLEVILAEYFLFENIIQGLKKFAGGVNPARYCSRRNIHTGTFKTLYLSVQRQVVNIFLYNDACQKFCPCHAFFNGAGGQSAYDNTF